MAKKLSAIESVRDWLQKQGYPFEMQVADRLHAARMVVTQGTQYLDPSTKRSREIDVVASTTIDSEHASVAITLVVECKYVKSKPWVLLLPKEPYFVRGLNTTNTVGNRFSTTTLSNTGIIEGLQASGVVSGPTLVAYAAVSAFRDTKSVGDEAYSSPVSVANATRAIAGDDPQVPFSLSHLLHERDRLGFWLPLIVLDGPLFTAQLGGGSLVVNEANWGRLFVKNPTEPANETAVDIVTNAGLDAYLSSLMADAHVLADSVSANPELARDENLALSHFLKSVVKREDK